MITVKSDRTAYISQGDRHIGYENAHLVEERLFEICDASLVDFSYKLDIKNTLDIVDLKPVTKTEDTVIVKWEITSSVIGDGGIIKVQLRAFDESGERVWHSEVMDFFADASINAEKEANQERILSEFEQLETRVDAAVRRIESSAQEAKTDSATAKENAHNPNYRLGTFKMIIQHTGNYLNYHNIFTSIREAEYYTGIGHSNISKCAQGKVSHAGGYKWKYAHEINTMGNIPVMSRLKKVMTELLA